eukprot:749481-Hanusia_phi.AAC.10
MSQRLLSILKGSLLLSFFLDASQGFSIPQQGLLRIRSTPLMMKKSISTKQNSKVKTSSGFGKSASSSRAFGSKKQVLQSDDLAQRLLYESSGNVAQAQSKFFNQKIVEMRSCEPELYSEMQTIASNPSMENAGSEASARLRQHLVEITWDTVAAFLPEQGTVPIDSLLQKKMIAIARACIHKPGCTLLDVGCGAGSILKFLELCEHKAGDYHGIDVSGNMIQRAQAQHPDALFEKTNFLDLPVDAGCKMYDTILFNGSIQFFVNQEEIIKRAKSLLNPAGRIVITHANGEEFVRQEKAGNRFIVPSLLPSCSYLEEVASRCDLDVIEKEGLDPSLDDSSSFYLQILAQR